MFLHTGDAVSTRSKMRRTESYLLEDRDHDIGAVIHSKDNVGHSRGSQTLDLVQDHGTIGKLDQWLGERESLDKTSAFVHAGMICDCWGGQIGEVATYERTKTGSKPSNKNESCRHR